MSQGRVDDLVDSAGTGPVNFSQGITVPGGISGLVYSMIRVTGAPTGSAGFGSTNTGVRIFSTVETSIGGDVVRTTSSVNGDAYTIQADGVYAVTLTDTFTTARYYGVTRNASVLNGSVEGLAANERLVLSNSVAADDPASVCWVGKLLNGDVIRAQATSALGGTNTGYPAFTIVRVY